MIWLLSLWKAEKMQNDDELISFEDLMKREPWKSFGKEKTAELLLKEHHKGKLRIFQKEKDGKNAE